MFDKQALFLQKKWNEISFLAAFIAFTILSVWAAAISGFYFLAAAPVVALVIYIAIVDFSYLYWLLIASIPFSTEIYLPNGLGTDLPTEPLMVGLMLLFGVFVLRNIRSLSADILRHPLAILLLLHLAWIFITTLTSDLFIVSLKFFLAKLWYISTFFFLTLYILREERDFKRFFWVFFWPFIIVTTIIFTRHAIAGFSFMDIHAIMHPFQRNHVNYAAALSLFFPFILFARQWYEKGSKTKYLLTFSAILVFVAIYFTFTRAAYVALIIAFGVYYIVRWKLMRHALALASIIVIIGVWNLVEDSKYLDFAPNFDRTISHENFDNLIEATYKMEDISTMERIYRWVAAGQMIPKRPLLGWGPGNFVNFYKPYTVTSFQTYVSDNPEKSGPHSYFFMTLVEQGIIGFFIFVLLVFSTFIRGEQLYHRLSNYPFRQQMVMTCLLSIVIISAFLLINDLIETDKIGSFFFINLAVIIQQDLFLFKKHRKEKRI